MKILIADDSKTTRSLLASSLKKLGHDIIEAENGQQAIDVFLNSRPDLIILDVIMEGLDGFECARRIRSFNTDDWIPIIFLSGAVDDENIARGINAGGDDYLTKPYSEITLFAKIKAMQRIADMRNKLYELTQKLSTLSSTDPLTGVYNRLQFDRAIKERISFAKRHNKIMALLFVDIDKFKTINDTLGHYIGDLLLIEIAKRLQDCLRLEDFIARIGGDEFAIILSNIKDEKTAGLIAKKIIDSTNKPFNIGGHVINISSSIGISTFPSAITDAENVVKNADIAMYHAKESGKNNYQNFTRELKERHQNEADVENALKKSLLNNEMRLSYHPIFNLNTHQINRVEVLLRWESPLYGRMSAEKFIPLAQKLEILNDLGLWTIRAACLQGKDWLHKGIKDCKISINISPDQLLTKDFIQRIKDILAETHFPPNLLEFELTETSVLIYSESAESVLNQIHSIGINITLDDFGTGYSSLIHLRRLPISAIKIDKTFIRDIGIDQHNAKIIKSVIMLGNNLGFEVIAEGIENREQLQFLIHNDCHLGQGYYLSKILDETEILELLKTEKVTI